MNSMENHNLSSHQQLQMMHCPTSDDGTINE